MNHLLERRTNGAHALTARYNLLVAAFGNDGTLGPRDEERSYCSWDVATEHGTVQVYDYRLIACCEEHPIERKDITAWRIQGDDWAIAAVLELLDTFGETP